MFVSSFKANRYIMRDTQRQPMSEAMWRQSLANQNQKTKMSIQYLLIETQGMYSTIKAFIMKTFLVTMKRLFVCFVTRAKMTISGSLYFRNLEYMGIARKRKGWRFQHPSVEFYHR